jgi:hypothetical protein
MKKMHSSPMRSRYDYYYSTPTQTRSLTQAENYFENQSGSLFGEFVPPVTDLLENFDNHLYECLRKKIDNNIQQESQNSSYSNQLIDTHNFQRKSSSISASDSQTSDHWHQLDDESTSNFRAVSAGAATDRLNR